MRVDLERAAANCLSNFAAFDYFLVYLSVLVGLVCVVGDMEVRTEVLLSSQPGHGTACCYTPWTSLSREQRRHMPDVGAQ